MGLGYDEWAKTCRDNSLDMSDEYSSRMASRDTPPSSEVPAVAGNSTFKDSVAGGVLVPRASETAGLVPIVVPIAIVLGVTALGTILAYIYWIKRRRGEESFGAFFRRRLSLRKIPKVHPNPDPYFEIDRQTESTNDFVMVSTEPSVIGVHSWGHLGHLKPRQPEYHFPFRNVLRNTEIIQQIRRIPDIVPHPWGSHPVHIRPSKPPRRFRVDPSGSTEESGSSAMTSQPGTVEGVIPATIEEGDEEFESNYHSYNGEEDEESSLIPDMDRRDNEVFLISKRPTFTLSSNSHSSNSHHFKIIPPTPTESSRSHGPLSQVIFPVSNVFCSSPLPLTSLQQPRRQIDIPPAPQRPAPVPPRSFPRRPSPLYNQAEPSVYQPSYGQTLFSKNDLPQAQVVPHPPKSPRSLSPLQGGSQQSTPLSIQTGPPLRQTSPVPNTLTNPNVLPRSGTPPRPIFPPPPAPSVPPTQLTLPKPYNVQRRPSAEGTDPLSHSHVPRRPMGARLPSSHARRPSIDEESSRFGPAVPSGDSIHLMSPPRPSARPLTPHHPQSPHARERSLSAPGDDVAPKTVFPPTRPTHARTLSSESLILTPDDHRLLYPGPVRAGGYNVNIPPDATGSLENLHSRPLPRERTR
ncbi:hypothetical protein C0992_005504 [Termitomyces sp. T32_za158]|nr:hypothetical protein C0992_005504 [Termitomyces sp. T32_za158]